VFYRSTAATILLSILCVSAVGLAPWSSAATPKTGPAAFTPVTAPSASIQAGPTTTVPGKNPHGPLCQKLHVTDQTFRKQEPNMKPLTSGNWSATQKFYVAYFGSLSKSSQAVIQVGKDVPQNVRSAARQVVANIKSVQKVILKAKSLAGLNASTNATLPSVLSAWNTVLEYEGAQCGAVGSSSQGITSTSSNPN
jgi:hypothetical protein